MPLRCLTMMIASLCIIVFMFFSGAAGAFFATLYLHRNYGATITSGFPTEAPAMPATSYRPQPAPLSGSYDAFESTTMLTQPTAPPTAAVTLSHAAASASTIRHILPPGWRSWRELRHADRLGERPEYERAALDELDGMGRDTASCRYALAMEPSRETLLSLCVPDAAELRALPPTHLCAYTLPHHIWHGSHPIYGTISSP